MFFRPVFNIADASISGGVFAILIFQSRFFPSVEAPKAPTEETETPTV
jgi:signal peptidase II